MKAFRLLSVVVIILVVITLIALGLFFYLRSTAGEPQYKDGKLVIPAGQEEILVTDIYAQKVLVLPESETVVFSRTEDALMTYNHEQNQFLIVLYDPNARKKVEKEFLTIMGITEAEACQMNVVIGMPYEVTKDVSQPFNLSFCPE